MLAFRQVHLDFHTSGLIPGIGEKFDKKQFQDALKAGHVNSITVFSKCHHGWSYHPTRVNEMHPYLKFDLLQAQLDACKEIGVRAPVYISAGLDEKEAVRHPEWLFRRANESLSWAADFTGEPYFHVLCFNTGYMDLLEKQIEEVMQKYDPCGIFLDIVSIQPCYCASCRNEILKRGKDPRNIDAAMEQAELVYKRYAQRVEKTIRAYSKTCTIFHNGGHIPKGRRDIAQNDTHLELESLPTGGWGYNHFPLSASYVMQLNKEYLGMTGKFHSTWGEFGGFKHPNALRYETALSLAYGAKCSIGDQLHPSGEMNEDTYRLIGAAYSEVEKKEPWCEDAYNIADVGVLSEEAVHTKIANRDTVYNGDIGANKILMEGKYLYRFLDLQSDFTPYKVIILPDTVRLDKKTAKRLADYVSKGGKILASGQSALASDSDTFCLDVGAAYRGPAKTCPDYVIADKEVGIGETAHVMYTQGFDIKRLKGKCPLYRQPSYFNRDTYSFCSHRHTPNNPDARLEEAADFTKNTVYISWNIFSDYGKTGSLHHKKIVMYALDRLLDADKTIRVSLPDKAVVTLTEQKKRKRYVVHELFAHTTNRGTLSGNAQEFKNIEVIEDIVPLYNIATEVRLPHRIKSVMLEPQHTALPFEYANETLTFTVPEVDCHQMIVLEY